MFLCLGAKLISRTNYDNLRNKINNAIIYIMMIMHFIIHNVKRNRTEYDIWTTLWCRDSYSIPNHCNNNQVIIIKQLT